MTAASCPSEILPENESKEWLRPLIKVSVIIPTHNRAKYLIEAIKSVLDQTFKDFELILVDDGSTDNTRDIIENFRDNRIRYIYQDNGGVSSARNTGIKAADGEYIAFLDSDDTWLPENLELKVKLLDSRPDLGLVCSDAYVVDNGTGTTPRRFWNKTRFKYSGSPEQAAKSPLKDLLYRNCFIMPQATIIPSKVFTTIGYFDESLPTSEDWDLFVRIVQRFPIEIINVPLLKIRRHNTSLSRNMEKVYLGTWTAINKLINSGTVTRSEIKILKQRLALENCRYGRLALLYGKKKYSRKVLFAGIKLDPWNFKLYIYLILTFPAIGAIQGLISRKKQLKHHPISCRSTEDAQLIN
jgi:glycosyltransferase involved in cell wall biosynthesis